MRQIRFAAAVAQDLAEIYEYIAADNVPAAEKLIQRFRRTWDGLRSHPGVGSRRDELGKQMRSIAEGNYVIYYLVTKDEIEIVRILHSSKDVRTSFRL